MPVSKPLKKALFVLLGLGLAAGLSQCYTVQQGVGQVKLIWKREPLDKVLAAQKEKPERLKLLREVPGALEFARTQLGLNPGESYKTWVPIDGSALTWVVQAAPKNELRLESWWFPIVGRQPYLGFFDKKDAQAFRDELAKEGKDVYWGGVESFSLLGWFPDPIYSSMVDSHTLPDFLNVLFHESVHRTLYIPNHTGFNENLAEWYARKGTELYLDMHPVEGIDGKAWYANWREDEKIRLELKKYLKAVTSRLTAFYGSGAQHPEWNDTEVFLAARKKEFEAIDGEWRKQTAHLPEKSYWHNIFDPKYFNNARLMSWSLYESQDEVFDRAFEKAQKKLPDFFKDLRHCLDGKGSESESALWEMVTQCKGPASSQLATGGEPKAER